MKKRIVVFGFVSLFGFSLSALDFDVLSLEALKLIGFRAQAGRHGRTSFVLDGEPSFVLDGEPSFVADVLGKRTRAESDLTEVPEKDPCLMESPKSRRRTDGFESLSPRGLGLMFFSVGTR